MISKQIALRNIKIQTWINFFSGIFFLLPVLWAFKQIIGLSIMEMVIIVNVCTFVVWIFELPTSVFADTMGRKKSFIISIICNFIAAFIIFVYPYYTWFLIASIFGGLYFAFWSGTGQAFLDENLRICWKQKEFGKVIWDFMFASKIWEIITPLIAAWIIKYFDFIWYRILAFLDVLIAIILIILVFKLIDTKKYEENFWNIKNLFNKNLKTAKIGLKNVFHNNKLKLILIYKSLSNPVAYLYVVFVPIIISDWMPEWYVGVIMTVAAIWAMLVSKFAYKISEKTSHNFTWVLASTVQGILYIIAGLILHNWILLIIIYILFEIFEHLWYPSWNHILVEHSQGIAVATTRSIIFWIFALYTTLWKQFLAFFPVEYALIGWGIFMILVNVVMGRRILDLNKKW